MGKGYFEVESKVWRMQRVGMVRVWCHSAEAASMLGSIGADRTRWGEYSGEVEQVRKLPHYSELVVL